MISRKNFIALFILIAIGLLATLPPTTSSAINLKSGAVYVLTNQVNNAVAAFDLRNNLIDSEASGGAPLAAAVSSYRASLDGSLEVVSGSVPDFQTAACWIVITNSGRYVYTTNTGTGVVSSYQLAGNGTLTLLSSVAASLGATSGPVDMALNNSSRYLYVLANGLQTVEAFRVNPDGSLAHIDSASGLPFGTQGIAAR